ncbi:hypothetical protein ASZ90_001344 [hydrocarbon metagenome]|uniref:Uncharacterized protein n=1 Tax=hydrocarbon metagenome TaxID=938273 RepID=A0A0W8G6L0_9ZZZZ
MQDRRDAQGLAHGRKPGSGQIGGGGHEQPLLAGRDRDAARDQDQQVALDAFPDQVGVLIVVLHLGVVAADHGHGPANLPGLYRVEKRPGRAAKGRKDRLVGEAGHDVHGLARDVHPALVPGGEPLDGQFHDLDGLLPGVLYVEFHMRGAGELGLGRGGDDAAVVAPGHGDQAGHDALVVHHHDLHGPGDDGQFGHEVVSGHGDALAHEQFVARAAQPGQVDPGGPGGLGLGQKRRVAHGGQDHLRDDGAVAVHQDVHVVGLEHPEIDLGGLWGGGAEDDVRQLRGDHGAAPAVGQGQPRGVQAQVHGVVVHAHVGAVHHLHHVAVDAPGGDAQGFPQLPPFGRNPADKRHGAAPEAVVLEELVGQGGGHGVDVLAGHVQADLGRDAAQFVLVADGVVRGFFLGHGVQGFHQVAAVVRMGGGPGGHHAAEVAGHDDVGVGPAHPVRGAVAEGVDAAGAHDAVAARQTQFAEAALGHLFREAVPDGFHPVFPGFGDHGPGVATDGIFGQVFFGHGSSRFGQDRTP